MGFAEPGRFCSASRNRNVIRHYIQRSPGGVESNAALRWIWGGEQVPNRLKDSSQLVIMLLILPLDALKSLGQFFDLTLDWRHDRTELFLVDALLSIIFFARCDDFVGRHSG